jgi:hypothetical protein
VRLSKLIPPLLLCLGLGAAWVPQPLCACAACFGQSNSALAKGMNMGIFSLLVVVLSVLGGIAAFFVYLARKSATPAAPVSEPHSPATK